MCQPGPFLRERYVRSIWNHELRMCARFLGTTSEAGDAVHTTLFYTCLYIVQALRRAGLGNAQAAQLGAWAQQLHAAVERMANVKEYRCAARWREVC